MDYSNGGDVILCQKGIEKVSDLRGKRVAAEMNSLNIYLLYRALELNGLKASDVEISHMDQIEMEDAFASKLVDAVVAYPPVSVYVKNKFDAVQVFSSRDISLEVLDILVGNKEFLTANSQQIAAIVRAINRAVEYTESHKDESYTLMASREKITASEFAEVIENDIQIMRLSDQQGYYGKGAEIETDLVKTLDIMKSLNIISSELGSVPFQTSIAVSQNTTNED